ncbi:MAG: 16S rRNA (cytidine(1402)-2'-O)-methyltransferase [Firmicutes bacterium]|nr:16S rRNA (cytidine(1402)-2'-O)-methyltransferase [Bacillota bacterium]
MNSGTLYLVATPIGNLDDITVRALETLKSVNVVAAEDTRHTRKLLSFYDIHVPLLSFREHNKVYQGQKLIERLKNGENIAMCSDAGMPLISDPGESFVRLCIENDVKVTVIPGANAALTGLVMSGFSANTFLYVGFIPRKKGKQMEFLRTIEHEPHTLIFYESPNRVADLLESILEVMGNRNVCVIRELTKLHEEAIRGTVSETLAIVKERNPNGEFTIVLEGKPIEEDTEPDYIPAEVILAEVRLYISEGMEKNKAFKRAASKFKTSKRAVYQMWVEDKESAE